MAKLAMKTIPAESIDAAKKPKRVYSVVDAQDRVVGFIAAKEKRNETHWGFAFVADELKRGISYSFQSRMHAVDALITMRSIKANTGSIKIVK